MLRAMKIPGKRATPRGHLAAAPAHRTLMTRASMAPPTLSVRYTQNTQVRHYGTDPRCDHDGDETKSSAQTPVPCITPPLIQARPGLTVRPLPPQTPPGPRVEPFNASMRNLFEALYDKLPLDHAKYTKVIDVPNDYAVLSKGDIVTLALHHSMFDSKVLTFPLNPKDAAEILACEKDREIYVQDLRKDIKARYIFSLEGVDRMRRTLDPDYQPL
jgi:hypothetical protein